MNSKEIQASHLKVENRRLRKLSSVIDQGLTAVLADSERIIEKIVLKYDGWEYRMVLVVSNEAAGERQVAFHSAETIGGCFMGMYQRAKSGEANWRKDKPYRPTLVKDEEG